MQIIRMEDSYRDMVAWLGNVDSLVGQELIERCRRENFGRAVY